MIPDMASDFPFLQSIQTKCGVLQPSVQLVLWALSSEGKLLRHQADHSPPPIAKLKLYIHCHVRLHGTHRDTFICTTIPKKGSGAHSPSYPVVLDFHDSESRNDTIISNCYCQMLQKSHTSSRRHHSKLTDSITLLYDTACPNVARRVEGQQNVKSWEMLKHIEPGLIAMQFPHHWTFEESPQMLYGSCLVLMC